MGHKTHLKPHKRREAVSQATPTFQTLVNRYNSGLTSRKEITRRVEANVSTKSSGDIKKSFEALKSIALKEGWIKEE
jgi:hypothetical protein